MPKRRGRGRLAVMMDVAIMLGGKEEFVSDMVPKLRLAAMKDAPIKQGMEEFVSDMVPKLRFAAMKDAQIKQGREEFVQVMVQK